MNLRHDSADLRLAAKGRDVGLLSDESIAVVEKRREGIAEIKELLKKRRLGEKDLQRYPGLSAHVGKTLYQILKSPEARLGDLAALDGDLNKPSTWMHTAELDVKYEGYIARQDRQIQKFQKLEWLRIPAGFDFSGVEGLSKESKEKLALIRPASVGQASRISGVRNADIALLMVSLGRKRAGEKR